MRISHLCGFELRKNQLQQLLLVSQDMLVNPTRICDVTDEQINQIVEQHNRCYGRTNPGCLFSVESAEKLKAFAQLFRKLEYQGRDLAAYTHMDAAGIDQAALDEAHEDGAAQRYRHHQAWLGGEALNETRPAS